MWKELINQSAVEFPAGRSLLLAPGRGMLVLPVKYYFRLQLSGRENLPAADKQPVLFALNHQSYLDPILFSAAIPSKIAKNTWFIAKDKYFNSPFRRWFAKSAQVMLIHPRMRLREAVPAMAGILKQGRNLAIFPEGTRTPTGRPGEFKKTFAIIAAATGCPVVPVAIRGAFEAAAPGKKFPRRARISIIMLPPVITEGLGPAAIAAQTRTAICEAMGEEREV
ncbi:MAG: 1-acyl-sn-glycerol-3-phosphate acyltransferase [Acidobacteria bacterium]|nr:1-acyl-sn-glycerol-3-phosphate acyltransferase [Acidobacteriota bacterium]